jgi:hypothetical protein
MSTAATASASSTESKDTTKQAIDILEDDEFEEFEQEGLCSIFAFVFAARKRCINSVTQPTCHEPNANELT